MVVVKSRLNLGGRTVVLRADAQADMLSSPLGRTTQIPFVNLLTYPWQRKRVVDAIRTAGFDVDNRSRWFLPWWQSVE